MICTSTKDNAIRAAWVAIAITAWFARDPLHLVVTNAAEFHLAMRLAVYSCVYVLMAGFAIPGAVLLTLFAGPLFGIGPGTIVASFASTAGATIAFTSSRRYMFRNGQTNQNGQRETVGSEIGRWELLLLRLTPVMPFFAVNVLAGRSRLSIKQFWLISQVGMLPATYLLVRVGTMVPEASQVSRTDMFATLWPLLLLALIAWLLRLSMVNSRSAGRFRARRLVDTVVQFSMRARKLLLPAFALVVLAPGCVTHRPHSSLAAIYNPLAQRPDYERNPVIVIPGVLGSRLVDDETGKTVWGKYDRIRFRRQQSDDLVAVSLPMGQGVPLAQLRDSVRSDGTLAYLELSVFGIPVELQAYNQILQTLGVGGYRDPTHPKADEFNYGDEHFTCFQFDYDWRRDVAENAALLDEFITAKRAYIQAEYESRYGITDAEIKFDIVAHSLGGLLSRYYLRYGSQPLPEDGSLPSLDWEGARSVERLIMIGTPNAGSAFALRDLVNGHQLSRVLPYYPPAALGTMPSIYQMLPRPRHQTLVDAQDPEQAYDFYDPELWRQMKWGLADPDQDAVLQQLLPEVAERESRHCIALDHQRKCLLKAKQFHQALDIPAAPPPGVTLHLYAGDAIETPAVMSVDTETGKLEVAKSVPGDDTTTRHSALMSEQPVETVSTRPASPIHWTSVMFLHTSHRKLTADPLFTDNVLALLLQSPRYAQSPSSR